MKFRAAESSDAEFLIPLFAESSGGVWPAVWKALAYEGESAERSGIRYLRDPSNDLSVGNTVVFESEGKRLGAMTSYREEGDGPSRADSVLPTDLILALEPYRHLRDPNSLFIAELCFLPEARGCGLGTRFLNHAKKSAVSLGLPRVSLRVFAENVRAVHLYERSGFALVDQRSVVPHSDIKANGVVLLMCCPV